MELAESPAESPAESRSGAAYWIKYYNDLYPDFTVVNSNNSPLLRLPREIRDMIWEYALEDDIIINPQYTSDHMPYYYGPGRFKYIIRRKANEECYDPKQVASLYANGGFAGTCRQMQAEAGGLQMQRIIFRFTCGLLMQDFCTEYEHCIASMKQQRIIMEWTVNIEERSPFTFPCLRRCWPDLKRVYFNQDPWLKKSWNIESYMQREDIPREARQRQLWWLYGFDLDPQSRNLLRGLELIICNSDQIMNGHHLKAIVHTI